MSAPYALDKRRVRRAFDRAAQSYDGVAVLQREVCDRALERLDLMRLQPRVIVDAGSGTGYGARCLVHRYPGATVLHLDIAEGMLRRARSLRPLPQRWFAPGRERFVCGDNERMPLREASAALVWSNLAFQWAGDLPRALAECRRVLHPGGLLMFTTFGPDTLKELRHAFAEAGGAPHVNRFIDMHDIGDMLVHAGLSNPVMDMEVITLTYESVAQLMRELKALGAGNAAQGRPRGLTGRRAMEQVGRRYETLRREGRLPATFEIVYGHAWKPERRTGPAGRPVIEIKAG
ncbi:MAG TPA: malonyl-ACP O-methyltransferase BioC [Burkholderiales bacterium]|nr:malonyl-ACP O-methyltransferase BioC [Burkholderiales bacterium]